MDFHSFDDASPGGSYLVVSESGRYVQVSAHAYKLLQAREAGLSFEEISAAMAEGKRASPAELEQLTRVVTDVIARVSTGPPTKPSGFTFAVRLIPASAVANISRHLTWMYSRWTLIVLALCGCAVLAETRGSLSGVFTHHDAVAAYCLFLLSLVVHEFGHSSACSYFGVIPREIGAAMYVVYPALYSEVSDVWRLKRWQRVVVDLAGNYFQAAFAIQCLLLFAITGWQPLRGTALLIGAAVVLSLNPLLRFDGYWILSDIVGVPNLQTRSKTALFELFSATRFGRNKTSSSTFALLTAYGCVSLALWTWLLVRVWPRMIWTRIARYPSALEATWSYCRLGHIPPIDVLGHLLLSSGLLYATILLLGRTGTSLYQLLRPLYRRFSSSNVLQGVTEDSSSVRPPSEGAGT